MHRFNLVLFIFCLAVSSWKSVAAGSFDEWHPQALRSIPYDPVRVNDHFIAVGRNGHILYSTNGLAWSEQILSETNQIYGVAYGNGMFVAVGTGGSAWNSNDGVSWSRQVTGTTNHLKAVTYGNGVFVAVASSAASDIRFEAGDPYSEILTSPDGVTWEMTLSRSINDLRNITFFKGRFYAFGGTLDFSSSDGRNWARSGGGSKSYSLAVQTGDAIIVNRGDYIQSTTNGVDWSQPVFLGGQPSTMTANHMAADSKMFLLVATKFESYRPCAFCSPEYRQIGLLVSGADGTVSSIREAPPGMGLPISVYHNGEQFVIVDDNRLFWISKDGAQWQLVEPALKLNFASIAFGKGLYVAVGSSMNAAGAKEPLIVTSKDGVHWEQETPENFGLSGLSKVLFSNGLFAAFQHLKSPVTNRAQFPQKIVISIDGKVWSGHDLATNWIYLDVAIANDRYLALAMPHDGSDAYILSSTNVQDWVPQSSPIKDVQPTSRLTFQNGIYFIGGRQGYFQSSDDGVNWFGYEISDVERVANVAYGNGKYVAVGGMLPEYMGQYGNASFALVSANGLTWKRQTGFKSRTLNDVAFVDGNYIAVGEPPLPLGSPLVGPPGTLYLSSNATNWNMRGPGDVPLASLASDGRSVVAVGEKGSIWKSGASAMSDRFDIRLSVLSVQTNGVLRVNVTSSQAGSAVFEASANLKEWKPIKNLALQSGSQIQDLSIESVAYKFYRVRLASE